MGQVSGSRRVLALTLAFAVVILALPRSYAAETAAISGMLVSTEDQSPLAGLTVHAADPVTGEFFSSAPTGDDGLFTLDNLPAATYEFAVESPDGLYVATTPLTLQPGETKQVNLAVAKTEPGSESAPSAPARGTPSIWQKKKFTIPVVIGFFLFLGYVFSESGDDNPPVVGSPSTT